jgi:hypothetical protein
MLSVTCKNDMLSVTCKHDMLSVTCKHDMLSVTCKHDMLSVTGKHDMLSVIMLSVVAQLGPLKVLYYRSQERQFRRKKSLIVSTPEVLQFPLPSWP